MRKFAVVAVLCWAAVAVVAVFASGRLDDVRITSGTSMMARDAESARVLDIMAGQGGRTVPALVVYERAGPVQAGDRAEVRRDLRRFEGVPGVVGTAGPPVASPDGRALQVTVLLSGKPGVLISPLVERLRQIVAEGRPPGLTGHVTGAGGAAADYVDSFRHVDGTLLALSVAVVFLVLLAVYRSPVLWVIPMLAVVVAYLSSAAAVHALADAGLMTLRGATPEVFTVLVFGVATDYALLLIARYRERLRVSADQETALRDALSGGIRTVVASALTVAGGIGCLLVADTNALRSIGAAASVGIVITMVVMVTLLPALMLLGGRRAFWPATPRPGQVGRDGLWRGVADLVGRRPRLSWAGSALLLALLCGGLVTLDASGIPPSSLFTIRTDSVAGYDALKRHYPASAPVVVLAERARRGAVAQAVRQTGGVVSMRAVPPTRTPGAAVGARAPRAGGALAAPPVTRPGEAGVGRSGGAGVARPGEGGVRRLLAAAPMAGVMTGMMTGMAARVWPGTPVSGAGQPADRWQVFDVVLAAEPNTADAERMVDDLRRSVRATAGGAALVGGFTTELLDTKDAALDDALLVVPLILLVVGLILIVLLRSLVAPLLLIGTVVLSFAATLGLCSVVFTRFLGYPAMDVSFTLYAFVFLIAFGIDYNIFLMARVREETAALDTRAATLHALRATGGVITAAGVVLAAAFFVLTVLPLVPVIQLGLLVAIGVVIDTVLVRSFLVPALAHHLGRFIWWPARTTLPARRERAPM